MKKIFFVVMFALLASSLIFAAAKDTNKKGVSGGNGNGGVDKIGGWVGLPFMGLTYSHEFNDLIEFDLLAGSTGIPFYARRLNIRGGVLFTVWEPVINGQKCPLTIGPALELSSFFSLFIPSSFDISVLCPIRWEVNFENIPAFNLFIEVAPRLGVNFGTYNIGYIPVSETTSIHVMPQFGIGLRYRIPGKK
ncbi:hypothetical protein [Treponema sp. OMZ 805]|uniref:hypothetical protein n=1 Tax=Treponema sp. OMZ 805 TaxID=2726068 RepID=UPI003D8D78F0